MVTGMRRLDEEPENQQLKRHIWKATHHTRGLELYWKITAIIIFAMIAQVYTD